MNTYYTYILSNHTNTVLYIWMTNNILRRIYEHKNKNHPWFTAKYNCTKLVYYEEYNHAKEAILREKQLKWRTRKKKDMLIDTTNIERKDLAVDRT